MKKLLAILMTLCMLPVTAVFAETVLVDYTTPAGELLESMTIGWNLGNTLDANGD